MFTEKIDCLIIFHVGANEYFEYDGRNKRMFIIPEVMADLYNVEETRKGERIKKPVISEKYHEIIQKNADRLNSAIVYSRDYNYNYFGFKTMERSYLLKINGKIVERPQHMLMRVAVGIHADDIDKVIETYDFLSERYFTHSSPTLFAACTQRQQLSRFLFLVFIFYF